MDHTNFKATLADLFLKQKGCDVQFTIKNSDGSSKKIGAHKVVLAGASDYFQTLFFKQQLEKNISNIDIIDIGEEAFTMLLKFMYWIPHENCKKVDPETMAEVYQAAHRYICKDVLKYVTDLMVQQVDSQRVIIFCDVAVTYDNLLLKEACVETFESCTDRILSSSNFLKASPQTVTIIFEVEHASIDSEIEFVRALERYTEHRKEFQFTSSTGVHQQLRPALNLIRFLTFTSTEIAETKLLTKEEVEKIIRCLPKDEYVSNMPDGFSVNRKKRYHSLYMRYYYAFRFYSCRKCNYCIVHKKYPVAHRLWECDAWISDKKIILKRIHDKYEYSLIEYYSLKDQRTIKKILEESGLLNEDKYDFVKRLLNEIGLN